jgi:hypothetical protein
MCFHAFKGTRLLPHPCTASHAECGARHLQSAGGASAAQAPARLQQQRRRRCPARLTWSGQSAAKQSCWGAGREALRSHGAPSRGRPCQGPCQACARAPQAALACCCSWQARAHSKAGSAAADAALMLLSPLSPLLCSCRRILALQRRVRASRQPIASITSGNSGAHAWCRQYDRSIIIRREYGVIVVPVDGQCLARRIGVGRQCERYLSIAALLRCRCCRPGCPGGREIQ